MKANAKVNVSPVTFKVDNVTRGAGDSYDKASNVVTEVVLSAP